MIGSTHNRAGVLLAVREGVIFRDDNGSRWRLEMQLGTEDLLGCRVRVDGVRIGSDMLFIKRIEHAAT